MPRQHRDIHEALADATAEFVTDNSSLIRTTTLSDLIEATAAESPTVTDTAEETNAEPSPGTTPHLPR